MQCKNCSKKLNRVDLIKLSIIKSNNFKFGPINYILNCESIKCRQDLIRTNFETKYKVTLLTESERHGLNFI